MAFHPHLIRSHFIFIIIIFAGLLSSANSLLAECPEGKNYNVVCESGCNKRYEKCRVASTDFDMCSLNQSKCMKGCYAKAAEKCAGIPGHDTNTDKDKQNEEQRHKDLQVDKDVWIAVGSAVAIGLIIIKLVKSCFDNDEVEWESTFQDALLEDGIFNEESNSLNRIGSGIVHGSNDSEMINVHSSMLVTGCSGLTHSMSARPYFKHD